MIHSYSDVLNLGHRDLAELLDGPVVVEEKVDGSQISFGKFDGEIMARSKGAPLNLVAPDKVFAKAIATIKELALVDGWTYRGEYLARPRHNVLAYEREPKRNIILFDVDTGGMLVDPETRFEIAEYLRLECVPVLYRGLVDDAAKLRNLMDARSILGGPIEGIVIKNPAKRGRDGKPLVGKLVSEQFRETKATPRPNGKHGTAEIIDRLADRFTTTARWQKAVQHLRDAGKLQDSPVDIGPLMREVNEDVERECGEEIRDMLFKWAWPLLTKQLSSGLPSWYKNRLLERQFENGGDA